MKTSLRVIPIICLALLLQGCGTNTPSYVTPENARIAAFVACSGTVAAIQQEGDRQHACDYIWSVASGIHTYAGGNAPAPAELQQLIATFSTNGQKWAFLGVSIGQIWQSIYPSVQGNQKLALDYLNAISEGCEQAAATCRTPQASPTP